MSSHFIDVFVFVVEYSTFFMWMFRVFGLKLDYLFSPCNRTYIYLLDMTIEFCNRDCFHYRCAIGTHVWKNRAFRGYTYCTTFLRHWRGTIIPTIYFPVLLSFVSGRRRIKHLGHQDHENKKEGHDVQGKNDGIVHKRGRHDGKRITRQENNQEHIRRLKLSDPQSIEKLHGCQ